MVPISIPQLKWWAKHGNHAKPINATTLPILGYNNMHKVMWDGDSPIGKTYDGLLYDIRRHDEDGLMYDPLSVTEILDDAEGVYAFDALVTPFAKLERKMQVLQNVMERVGGTVKPVAMQITEPFKQRGTANVAVLYELSDGQTLSIFFHNPDVTPQKINPTDDLISWKWMLNKKDVTIVAAPERGVDLNVREVANRLMRLAERNSATFQRANVKRSARMQAIETLKAAIAEKEATLARLQRELEVKRVEKESTSSVPDSSDSTPTAPVPDPIAEPVAEPVSESAPETIAEVTTPSVSVADPAFAEMGEVVPDEIETPEIIETSEGSNLIPEVGLPSAATDMVPVTPAVVAVDPIAEASLAVVESIAVNDPGVDPADESNPVSEPQPETEPPIVAETVPAPTEFFQEIGTEAVAVEVSTPKVLAAPAIPESPSEMTADDLPPDGEVSESDDDELSDDPNSPNYRYGDTGYIADSRKEKAASVIAIARKSGLRLRASDVDWNAIEQNPRQATDLITKSNLFGKTDWTALQDSGMPPEVGFLIDKVYASIGSCPSKDGALSRKDYAFGLETIRDRLEEQTTVVDVLAVLAEIKDELSGTQLNLEETEQIEIIRSEVDTLRSEVKELDDSSNELYRAAQQARADFYTIERGIDSRKRRNWTIDPKAERAMIDAKTTSDDLWARFATVREEVNPKLDVMRNRLGELSKQERLITMLATARNQLQSPVTRAWLTFGERFLKLLHYRSFRGGSDSFAGHVTNAKTGKILDWSWADKERPVRVKGATKQEINFQMKVADTYVRKGGRLVSVNSTHALKDTLGFRDVQSGNWVLKDPNSAKFHVEQTAAAMSDLADMLGIDQELLGFRGRLGMAFGARGSGGKNAARAHYEPVHRVINLTKMGGGGSLGHEYFHALDNVMHELVSAQPSGKKNEFVTANPNLLPEGDLRDAVKALNRAIMDGDLRAPEVIKFTEKDVSTAKYNIDAPRNRIARAIKDAGNATAGVLAIDAFLAPSSTENSRIAKQRNQWRKLAAAYYASEGETMATLAVGMGVSSFAFEAATLDKGQLGGYWSQLEELSARGFQAWIEDRMAQHERQNDYLSAFADNKYHYDPLLDIQYKPFPEGEERIKINAAFDNLFEVIRKNQVFEKANANEALLDSIFNASQADSSTPSLQP
jgi:hypothetical protein